MALELVIGNKNYSSWSMRPWVLMRQLGIDFDERKLRFDFSADSPFRRAVSALSPAGRVPVLLVDGFPVWDSLAIVETLAERHPGVWPADARRRARARSLCAEMHAGFLSLRQHCAMNIEAELAEAGARVWAAEPGLRQDLARIESMWAEALADGGGPFLFGAFGAADAFYAPVCTRIVTYGLPVSATTRGYVERVLAAPGVAAWIADARAEGDFVPEDEPYRDAR